ncbi:preprotein translocase subunit SecG [Lachnospiraceae bacterium]|nr:preprotein translocase subunit SecG [Lachnospiraceae bacterium]
MKIALTIIFLIIAIVLACLVLKQEGKDNGFTGSFTGAVDSYWSKNKKHSKEAVMQRTTAILGALFIIIAALLSSKWLNG